MEGVVVRVVPNKGFGFIRHDGLDYFFHRQDFFGDWDFLENEIVERRLVRVEFDGHETPKGMRAENVQLRD
jgi:cold shock CspA family protein